MLGQRFDRYEIESELGAGGMGRVYKALDTKLQRRVALKVLLPSALQDADRDEAVARLLREARLAAALEHPNVVHVYDVGESNGVAFVAMEFIRGHTLRRYVGDPSISLETRTGWLLDVAAALAAAHREGLIHRDVKPENVMLRDDGAIKVLDFGIARRSHVVSEEGATVDAAELRTLPQTGGVVGTPSYMPPEQIRGETLDGRCDEFAWGVMAYELLGGVSPWGQGEVLAILGKVLTIEPAPLLSICPEVAPNIAEAVDRALKKLPKERFDSMNDLIASVRGEVSSPPGSSAKEPIASIPTFKESAQPAHVTTQRASIAILAPTKHRAKSLSRSGVILLALLATLVIGVGLVSSRKSEGPGVPSQAAVDAASNTAPGILFTDLPLGEKPLPEAEKAYREGLQAFRSGLQTVAVEKMRAATQLDPSFAAANLQLSVFLYWSTSTGARGTYLKAVQLRDRLNARDRAFLTGMEPCVLPEITDYQACARSLGAAAKAYPNDAELAALVAGVVGVTGDYATSLPLLTKAIDLDPGFVAAVGTKALHAGYAGLIEQSEKLTKDCLAQSPNATLCLWNGVWLAEQRGDRVEFSRYARATWINGGDDAYPWFADALYVKGESRDAVVDALRHYWSTLPEASRGWIETRDRAALAALDGDFRDAAIQLDSINEKAIVSDESWRWVMTTALWLDVLAESGQLKEAGKIATALRGRLAALPANPNSEDWGIAEEPLPMLLDFQLRADTITRTEFVTARDQWLSQWRARSPAYIPYLWLHGYAAHTKTREEAEEALGVLPSFGGIPGFRPLTTSNFDLGRMYFLAGKRDEALAYLKKATQSSAAVEYPMALVRSRLFYGMALAESGAKAEACEAFARVIAQWGKAKPKSMTADEARRRAASLGCDNAL